MSSTAPPPDRDRLIKGALWGGAVLLCGFPRTAPCARALFTVGVIASVGKDVKGLRDESQALRGELAGAREEVVRLRGEIDRRFELAREWMNVSYWTGRADEREIWEKRARDLEPPPEGPPEGT